MLVIKIVEAVVRIVGGVGFDHSNRVMDSGLFGACGLLGCCGSPRKRHRTHRKRYRSAEVSHSEPAFSILPPPALVPAGTPRGSTHSGQPPSVLRPEHAMRPYREESDDESGYIMGAWQSPPRPGYNIVQDAAPQPAQAPMGSGFSRVGGGRAHFETPYAIATGSTQTFPSVGRGSGSLPSPHAAEDDESPPPSVSHVARRQDMGLPLGAMQPSHIRTKSQTAIIEDASTFFGPVPVAATASRHAPLGPGEGRLQPPLVVPVVDDDDDDDESDSGQLKKKSWFHLRRQWPRNEGASSGSEEVSSSVPADAPGGGRSFVVVRDKKPSKAPHPLSSPPAESGQDASSAAQDAPGSFVVIGRKGGSS